MKRKILTLLFMMMTSLGLAKTPEVDLERTEFTRIYLSLQHEERTLLLSDSPEYVGTDFGILYRGTVSGAGRVYFYHVNENKEKRKLALVLHNKNIKPVTLTVERKIMSQKPTAAYFEVGRSLSARELETTVSPLEVQLDGGAHYVLFEELNRVLLQEGDLFSGLVDFHANLPVEVSVMMLPYYYSADGALFAAKDLPADKVYLRGTFANQADRHFTTSYDNNGGAAYVELANDEDDAYIVGVDEMNAEKVVTNRGNYGVSSLVDVVTEGKGSYHLFFNPLGGAFAGSLAITYDNHERIVDLPRANQVYIGHGTIYDTLYIGSYEAGKPLKIRFMPPGASNLPVRLLFVPQTEERSFFRGLFSGNKLRNPNKNLDE